MHISTSSADSQWYHVSMYNNHFFKFFYLHHNIFYSKSPVYNNLNGPGVNNHFNIIITLHTVDSRYLEFDGTMEKIRVNRCSTQEELRRYRKCGLFNNERETTRAKFWRAKTSIACPYSRNDFKHIRCFCCCVFLSVKFFESCETTDNF
jgi:hypothetical protein